MIINLHFNMSDDAPMPLELSTLPKVGDMLKVPCRDYDELEYWTVAEVNGSDVYADLL